MDPVISPPVADAGHPSEPSSPKIWQVGSLTYSARGLVTLFCWLIWGDFAWSLRDRIVPPVMQLLFKKFGASDALAGILFAALPAVLGLIIGPVVGYNSDRLRTRWGRRIPPVALVEVSWGKLNSLENVLKSLNAVG